MDTDSTTGRSAPLGATVCAGGVNFCIYSRSAERMELLFFDDENDRYPARVILINPIRGVQKWKQLLHRSWILNPFLGTPTNHHFMRRIKTVQGALDRNAECISIDADDAPKVG